jgi:hypothetical protein
MRGAGHMLFFRDRYEIAQMAKFHRAPEKTKNIVLRYEEYILHI